MPKLFTAPFPGPAGQRPVFAAQRNGGKARGVCGVRRARPQATVPLSMGRRRKWDLFWLLGRQDWD